MGIISGLMGNASEVDIKKIQDEFEPILADIEKVEKAYRLVRDLFVFTNKRLILVDKQGATGKKTEYHSIPYKSITHFSVESTGHFDLDAELKIWISSTSMPIDKQFKNDKSIYEIQKTLAHYMFK
ncbi:PH domain-containing protein [Clostridium grantii]|uniref:PH domain-containing protein n=1 Tax=Clostridium grantii DSM 8605 TaxID=1121316 RepID=A0A1M5TH20_9CLOT|nr:PH domain-containing protein [Clostridium grantii]SHH49958.1 PH domain-containing protein [Clostridium grantii DSM 8605]